VQVELADKLARRYPQREITLGQRLSYVLVQGEKGVKQWQQSEEPSWVDAHGLSLDLELYMTNYLQKPLVRLFALPGLCGTAEKATKLLFTGEHMRARTRKGPSAGDAGTLGAFFKKETGARCSHCKRPITSGKPAAAGPSAAAGGGTGHKALFSRIGAAPGAKLSAAATATAAKLPAAPSTSAAATSPAAAHGLCGDCESRLDQVVCAHVEEYAVREAHVASLANQW